MFGLGFRTSYRRTRSRSATCPRSGKGGSRRRRRPTGCRRWPRRRRTTPWTPGPTGGAAGAPAHKSTVGKKREGVLYRNLQQKRKTVLHPYHSFYNYLFLQEAFCLPWICTFWGPFLLAQSLLFWTREIDAFLFLCRRHSFRPPLFLIPLSLGSRSPPPRRKRGRRFHIWGWRPR